jgi:hypothetical protein
MASAHAADHRGTRTGSEVWCTTGLATLEICGAAGDPDGGRWTQAHERWHSDEITQTNICSASCLFICCHEATRYGLARPRIATADVIELAVGP